MQTTTAHFNAQVIAATSAYNANNLQSSVFTKTVQTVASFALQNATHANTLTQKQQNVVSACIALAS